VDGRERARGFRLRERGGAGQGARLVFQDLQVMAGSQDLGVLASGTLVPGHHLRSVQHLDASGRQADWRAAADIPGRVRLVVLSHADPGPLIGPGPQQPRRVERLAGVIVGGLGGPLAVPLMDMAQSLGREAAPARTLLRLSE